MPLISTENTVNTQNTENTLYIVKLIVKSNMSIEKAKAHLALFGLDGRIEEFSVSSATVALAAKALGTEEERIAKTLSFLTSNGAVLVVAAGDARIDNRKFKDFFHEKAKMMTPDELVDLVGYAAGGVCPFGVNEGVSVYLDKSLLRFDTVYPAAGTASSAVRLSIKELEASSGYLEWIDVTKLPETRNE